MRAHIVQYIIFDDDLTSNFYPITLTKPSFDLILGTGTLIDILIRKLNLKKFSLIVKPYLADIVKQKYKMEVNPLQTKEDVIFINGRIILNEETEKLLMSDDDFLAFSDNILLIAKLSKQRANQFLQGEKNLKEMNGNSDNYELPSSSMIRYPWELIERNLASIKEQSKEILESKNPDLSKCNVIGPVSNLKCKGNVNIEPFVTLDLRNGPIILDHNASIESNSRIEGPTYIGKMTTIKSARINKGTSILNYCKVGGEVDNSIISSYSNKAHNGFLGHSYVGEWVNIGAGTSNSDIKNTYGSIKMNIGESRIDTKNIKLGCFISDYAKISIGSFIYTGKKIGVSSHIHGYVTENVPSFTIYSSNLIGKNVELHLDSSLKTQKRIMSRRNVKQTKSDKDLLSKVFQLTQDERYMNAVGQSDINLNS